MTNQPFSYKDNNENKKGTIDNLWQSLRENPALGLLIAMVPIGTLIVSATNLIIAHNQYKDSILSDIKKYEENKLLAAQQHQEKSLAEYVEFVKTIFFDVYYSNSKDPRIPAESVSNFISSKTVTTLKTLENPNKQTNKQKELIDFLKQAKIGFLPVSEDPKTQDIPDKIIEEIKDGATCPLDYISKKQTVIYDEYGKVITPHPRITNPCLLTGINLSFINLNEQDLSFVVLKNAQLRGTKLRKAQLQKANLRGADLLNADLTEAYSSEINLNSATLIGANLNKADLRGAILTNANLTSIQAPNLEGKIVYYTTDLTDAKLQGANLQGAQLIGTVLTNANLSLGKDNKDGRTIDVPTNLTGANLKRAKLIGTDLTKANLKGATLDGADLTDANLQGAQLDPQITEEKALKLKGVTLCRTKLPNSRIAEPDCKF